MEHVISEPPAGWSGLKGFIDAPLIRKYAGVLSGKSFFVCGPPAMYRFLQEQFAHLGLPRRQIRRELAGAVEDITLEPGYPAGARVRIFQLHLRRRGAEYTARRRQMKASLRPWSGPAWLPIRSAAPASAVLPLLLTAGEVYVRPESDGRRAADRRLGFIHPCASYPLSDLSLTTP